MGKVFTIYDSVTGYTKKNSENSKQEIINIITNVILTTFSAFLSEFALHVFVYKNSFAPSGIDGIATMIQEILATGVMNIINAFHPEAVILGGGLCADGDIFLHPLKEKVERDIFGGVKFAPVEIVIASLGNKTGICGAAALTFNK